MQSRSSQSEAIAITESETYQTLLARAHRRTGGVPPERIVRHVLSVTHGGDWPVQRDALDAVLRRCASAHTDEIQIVGRHGARCWVCTQPPPRSRARPYRTLLRRIERSTAVASAPISSEIRSACASTWSPSSSTWSRSGIAAMRARVGSRAGALALGPGPSADRPWRLADAHSLGGRHTRPRSAALVASSKRKRLDGRGSRSVAAAAGARGSIAHRAPRRQREPALHALLQEERARLARQIQTASTRTQLHHALHTLKQSLYRYQHDGVERFLMRGRLLLATTWVSQDRAGDCRLSCPLHTGRVRRGLLVVPAALKPQWLREWQVFTDAPATIIDGSPSSAAPRSRHAARVLLGNYEQLIRDLEVVRDWRRISSCSTRAQRIKKLGDQDRAHGETPGSAVPSRIDWHTDGEPAR